MAFGFYGYLSRQVGIYETKLGNKRKVLRTQRNVFAFLGVTNFIGAMLCAWLLGFGQLLDETKSSLKPGTVYETVAQGEAEGKTVAILKTEVGNLFAYVLQNRPPKFFMVSGTDKDRKFVDCTAPKSDK